MASKFEPLNSFDREIRVLSFVADSSTVSAIQHGRETLLTYKEPGSAAFTSEIRCAVCPISLDSTNPEDTYCALSYVWGVQEPTTPISLNGQRMDVVPNLLSALQHLRRHPEAKGRKLWIDAICINQADLEEKARQVDMMGEIFRRADKVFIWLGREGEGSNLAMDLLNSVPTPGDTTALKHFVDTRANHDEAWIAVKCLFERDYWRRLWVLQEILLSKQAYVLCGDRVCAWESIMTLLKRSNYSNNIEIRSTPARNALLGWKMVLLVDIIRSRREGRTGLLDYLVLSRQRQASVAHDYIYGVLGLVEERILYADYKKCVEDVYRDIALYMLRSKGDLRILSMCCETASQGINPTWVPDWRNQYKEPYQAFLLCLQDYDAGLASINEPDMDFLQNSQVLQIKGKLIDIISFTSPTHSSTNRWPQVGEDWTAWLTQAPDRTQQYGQFEGQREAFRAALYCQYGAITTRNDGSGQYFDLIVSESTTRPTREELSHPKRSFGKVGRQFFGTEKGYMGRGLCDTEKGDVVVVIKGAKVPFVLRKSNTDDFYYLVGECLLRGLTRRRKATELYTG
ncbi:hypothetical protein TruAng_003620 [Truncatella angustata]|nr:hypothetical protein TruAng_003620 [Truncatella angustata]